MEIPTPPICAPFAGDVDTASFDRVLLELQRYSGWLAKDHASVAVRADVEALRTAMDRGSEPALLLQALDENIKRLPGGGVRKLLRRAVGEMRDVLEPATIDLGKGDHS